MHRRSFLSLSALSAVPVVAKAADEAPETKWYKTVDSDVLKFKAIAEDGKITLQVELFKPADADITEAKDSNGGHHYLYKGKPQPFGFNPGVNLLKRFDLTWDGTAMPIPERFWTDLPGLCLQTSTLDPEKVPTTLHRQATQFLESLYQPRLSLSAEGGTVLISWDRPEECDSRSTIRWIVSKSGVVLRHRHCPPHEC